MELRNFVVFAYSLTNMNEVKEGIFKLPKEIVFELDKNLKPIKDYYLGNQDMIAKKMASVENQGKAK